MSSPPPEQEESQDGMTTAAEESQDTQEEIVDQAEGEQDDKVAAGGAKKKKQGKEKTKLPIFTKRDPIDRVPLPSDGTRSFTVLSWNVNGIRAVVKNGLDVLRHTVKTERPDLVCFQETKIQEKDIEAMRKLDILPGYASEWSCSTAKKGYAGTAVFFPYQEEEWKGDGSGKGATGNRSASDEPAKKKLKQGKISTFFSAKPTKQQEKQKKQPEPASAAEPTAPDGDGVATAAPLPGGRSGLDVLSVRFGIGGNAKHNQEGRSITVEYEKFFVVTVYVPNSGEKLVRLAYRTEEWDLALRTYVERLESEGGKPVVLNGDLNVAHLDLDIYNRGAKHLLKCSGTTEEERDSFGSWLKSGKVADAFRRLYPDAEGAYTYWSVRTNARPENKGLRLDYFVCSNSIFEEKDTEKKKDDEGTATTKATAKPATNRAARGKGGGGIKKGTAETVVVHVHDCFVLETATPKLSDHCPVGLTLRLP